MFMRLYFGWRLPAAMLAVVFLLGGATGHVFAQANGTVGQDAGAKAPAYEIVSIKLADPGDRNANWETLPNGFDLAGWSLMPLIKQAYGITMDSQISGLPEWVKSDKYVVSARVDEDTAAAWKKLPRKELAKQQQLMLQAMFAERFQLKMRREVKVLAVYDLVIAKGGLKMKEAAPDEKETSMWRQTSMYSDAGQSGGVTTVWTIHAGTPQSLVGNLSSTAGRVIVDKTGLDDKRFDGELKWSSDQQAPAVGGDAGPSLFTAVEEQLGLKLEPAREPVDTFVVEHIERPSAN
jgi:uncharacterized protein (TIGR03435 family)